MDRNRLVKLLALTNSPNDNEALIAMRKANAALEGKTWDSFFSVVPSGPVENPLTVTIIAMLNLCIQNLVNKDKCKKLMQKYNASGLNADELVYLQNTYKSVWTQLRDQGRL